MKGSSEATDFLTNTEAYFKDGHLVIHLSFRPWNRKEVYFYEGIVYVRRGANVFEAKAEEVRRLHNGKSIV